MAQTLGAGDRRLSLKVKAELSLGKESFLTWLLSVLNPLGPPSLFTSIPSLIALFPSPLQFHPPSVFFYINSLLFSFVTEPLGKFSPTSIFFQSFWRSGIKSSNLSESEGMYFLSFFASKEGKKTEHFHFLIKTG